MKVIRYLVVCFTNGDFYKIGISDDPNEATDIMKRDVLHEMGNRGYSETDKEYIGVDSGNYGEDYYEDAVYIDVRSASFKEANMYWNIMQIDIEEK